MANITGIDLGTTNSVAAILNEIGKPEIVPNVGGERITPSLLLFNEDVVEIGSAAKERARSLLQEEAHRFVREIKRKMPDLNHRISILGKSYSPASLSALILKKTASGVLTHRGGVGPVAISVPAYFHEAERKATLEAGELANLDVVSIVNEPTAAALAYSIDNELDGNYLVFDLGGGTFDVTVLSGKGTNIEVLTTQGNSMLGGSDFDRLIFDRWCKEYMDEAGEALCLDEAGNYDALAISYLEEAQSAKHALSRRDTHTVMLRNNATGKNVKSTISRKEFEESISSHLASSEMLLELALKEAKLTPNEITRVLLVGGSTRIPAVVNMVRKHFEQIPSSNFNPDEIVALGAAIHASVATIRERPKFYMPSEVRSELENRMITDVVNHSYGTFARARRTKIYTNFIMIRKNEPLPATHEMILETSYDNQRALECTVTQGEETDPAFLPPPLYKGSLELPSPLRPAGRKMRVQFKCDANHVLHCLFEDVESGKMIEVKLDLAGSNASKGDDKELKLDELNIQ